MSLCLNSTWKVILKELDNFVIVFLILYRGSLGTVAALSHPFLVFLFLFSILNITLKSNGNQFGVVFLVMWGGSFVVTINTKLLGGKISFFQCVCVLGYCIFPIVLGAAVMGLFKMIHMDIFIIRLVVAILCLIWAGLSIQ